MRAGSAGVNVPPQGYLLISRGGKVLTRITLGQRTLIGRSEHNDVCLPSPYLSRHHAVIVGTPEGYYVVDLNSVNGLQVNGRAVERAALCDQDLLAVGPFRLKVQIPEWLAQEPSAGTRVAGGYGGHATRRSAVFVERLAREIVRRERRGRRRSAGDRFRLVSSAAAPVRCARGRARRNDIRSRGRSGSARPN